MNIFVSCGEVSGDIYAAGFIRELLRLRPEAKVWGMLGTEAKRSGGAARWSYEELKLMGIVEVIPALPRLLRLKNDITREVVRVNPDAAVLIDSPDFHLLLAHSLRKAGYAGKIISLIPPTVWAWRAGRVKNLKRDYDLCLPLFSFEHKFLLEHGVKSLWTSHPLVHELEGVRVSEAFRERFATRTLPLAPSLDKDGVNAQVLHDKGGFRGVINTTTPTPALPSTREGVNPAQVLHDKGGANNKVIALMPGSRRYDINYHLDILLGTAERLKAKGYLPVFSVAPGLTGTVADVLRGRVGERGFELWEGEGRELMLGSCAVAGVSGTVAVEAMLLERYMVVIYNMKRLTYAILKHLVHVKNISIPNMLTSRQVYPELLCDEATPENIVRELERYLDDEDNRREIDASLHDARASMGTDNAARFWSECIIQAINS